MKIEIDDKIAKELSALTAINGTPPEKLAARMIAREIKDSQYWREYEEDKASLEAMKNGDFISEEEMFAKMDKMAEEARQLAKDID